MDSHLQILSSSQERFEAAMTGTAQGNQIAHRVECIVAVNVMDNQIVRHRTKTTGKGVTLKNEITKTAETIFRRAFNVCFAAFSAMCSVWKTRMLAAESTQPFFFTSVVDLKTRCVLLSRMFVTKLIRGFRRKPAPKAHAECFSGLVSMNTISLAAGTQAPLTIVTIIAGLTSVEIVKRLKQQADSALSKIAVRRNIYFGHRAHLHAFADRAAGKGYSFLWPLHCNTEGCCLVRFSGL